MNNILIVICILMVLQGCSYNTEKHSYIDQDEIKADTVTTNILTNTCQKDKLEDEKRLLGLALLNKFKDSVEFDFDERKPKLKLTYKDFDFDTSILSDIPSLFLVEGTMIDVNFFDTGTQVYTEVKNQDGEWQYTWWLPDDKNIVKEMRKHIKVGNKIKCIGTIGGARYDEFLELRIY